MRIFDEPILILESLELSYGGELLAKQDSIMFLLEKAQELIRE